MTLTFEPLLTPAIWVTIASLAIGFWVWYVVKRPQACGRWLWIGLAGLMAVSIASILLVLLNPIWLQPLPPPGGKPLLTILVDESKSMLTLDAGNRQTRYRAATEAAERAVAALENDFEIRIQTFAEESRPVGIEQLKERTPAGSVSDLATPLLDGFVSDRPQGQAILLLSDGIHNAPGSVDRTLEAANTAKTWDAPIFTTTLGAKSETNDIELRIPRSQELAFVGQSIPVTVELQQRGTVSDRVNVTLTTPEGEESTQEVKLTPGKTTDVTFLVSTTKTGLFPYKVSAEPLPGEATPSNNAASFQVRVVDKPVKALVLEGKPYWDSKFLLRMLTDDPSLEVDCLVRVAPERFLWRHLKLEANTESTTPTEKAERRFQRRETSEFVTDAQTVLQDAAKLSDYQILLLGREAENYLTGVAVDNIREWVSTNGGSLVCYRGSPVAEPDQKLSRLLPVRWAVGPAAATNESRFRVQVTERGDDLSWLRIGGSEGLSKLPSLTASAATDSIKPLAIVLGRGGTKSNSAPALTYQPYGTGKVVVVEGSGMWRWAFLAPEYRQLDSAYGILWQSLIRWLVSSGGLLPGEEIALQMDRISFTAGESVSAVVLRRPESDLQDIPNVDVYSSEGQLLQSVRPIPVGDELGVYQVFVGTLPIGHYELKMAVTEEGESRTKSVHFDVWPDLREQLEVSARSDLMQRIAEVSGGAVISRDDPSELKQLFTAHIQKSRSVQYRRIAAWDRWWVLVGILSLWTTTWGLRRRTGLI